jgi:hypothetical protein
MHHSQDVALTHKVIRQSASEGRLDLERLSSDIFVLNPESAGAELESPGIYARVLDANGNVVPV